METIKKNLLRKIQQSILDEEEKTRKINRRLELRKNIFDNTRFRIITNHSDKYNNIVPTYSFDSREGIERAENSDAYRKLDQTAYFLHRMNKPEEFWQKVGRRIEEYKGKIKERTLTEREYNTIMRLPKVGLIKTIINSYDEKTE